MQGVPGGISPGARPPTSVPLRHFVVGLAFLVAGLGIAALPVGGGAAFGGIAVAHLLLVGWVCLTILGAVTLFVPVWSGVELASERLASVQLALVAAGVAGFAASLWLGRPADGVVFAGSMVAGFLVFVGNAAATLWRARPFDGTEAHFAVALGWFALAVLLGGTLAADFRWGVLAPLGIDRTAVANAHVTLAVLGGVLTTVIGALDQLGPMFTQAGDGPLDDALNAVERAAFVPGVALLAGGRLAGHAPVASVGGVLVAVGVAAASLLLADRVRRATVPRTPMISRYAVVGVAGVAWAATAAATWVADPLAVGVRFGHPSVGLPLLAALVGFVVVGSLYHVVPFIVWLDRYSHRVGLERVPAIDDLYDDRVAAVDFAATLGGLALVALGSVGIVGDRAALAGGAVLLVGALLFAGNVVSTVVRHAPRALTGGDPGDGGSEEGTPERPGAGED